jgi:hypothetical protein
MGPRLSGLTKKCVYADKTIARILSVTEGDHVSYAELSRGLHKYIKDNGLSNPRTVLAASAPSSTPNTVVTAMRKCRDCDAEIPVEALFCDLCGVRQ